MYGELQWSQSDSVLYLFGQPVQGSYRQRDVPEQVDPHIVAFCSIREQAYASAGQAHSREEYVARFMEAVQPYIGGVIESCTEGHSTIILTMAPCSPGQHPLPLHVTIPREYPIIPQTLPDQRELSSAVFAKLIETYNGFHAQGDVLFFGDGYMTSVPASAWPRTAEVMRALLEADDPDTVDTRNTAFAFPAVFGDWVSAHRSEEE
jgi:hypothetical protein